MRSTHEGEINAPNLPPAACTLHAAPDLSSHSLLSTGQLCDAELADADVIVQRNDIAALQDRCTPANRLWRVKAPKAPIAKASVAVSSGPAAELLVSFARSSLFSPLLTTLVTALNRHLHCQFSRPFLAHSAKPPSHSVAAIKGHLLGQSRKNQQSTKTNIITSLPNSKDTQAVPE